jgi:5-methylcytosine-specific restriction endonuclease McrA
VTVLKPPLDDARGLLAWAYTQPLDDAVLDQYRSYAQGGPLPQREVDEQLRHRRHIPRALWERVLADSPLCSYCELRTADTVDHVIPVGRGGGSSPENLVPACWPCNRLKGALPATDELRSTLRQMAVMEELQSRRGHH